MTKEEVKFVVKTHEEIVMTQVMDNVALRKAYNMIQGRPEETLVSPIIAKQTIYSWYVHNAQAFLKAFEEVLTEPSHTEESHIPKMDDGDSKDVMDEFGDELFDDVKRPPETEPEDAPERPKLKYETMKLTELDKLKLNLTDLMNLYDANPTPENKKAVTAMKSKITKLKKKK